MTMKNERTNTLMGCNMQKLSHKVSGLDKDQPTPIYFHKLLDFSYLIQTQRAVFDPVTRLMTLEATVCSWDFSHLTSTPYFHVT
jgi:hypothetical protein